MSQLKQISSCQKALEVRDLSEAQRRLLAPLDWNNKILIPAENNQRDDRFDGPHTHRVHSQQFATIHLVPAIVMTHSMIEELLQFLVGIVDAELFEAVEAKDFESSNVQDTNK